MSRTKVYIIPSPIGDLLEDFSVASLRTIKKLTYLFVEEDDNFIVRMRRKKVITDNHKLFFLNDSKTSCIHAAELIKKKQPFGIMASSGLPCFIDPGYEIINILLLNYIHEIELVPVGMNSALDAALTMTGKEIQTFLFLGHFPECYEMDAKDISLRRPIIYFVRGPAMEEFLTKLKMLNIDVDRIMLFRNIRKRENSAVIMLTDTTMPTNLLVTPDAEYVVSIIQKKEFHNKRTEN